MDIKKIKYADNMVEIEYFENINSNLGEEKAIKFKSNDEPAADFVIALRNLGADIVEIIGVPEDYQDNMEVRGITLSYGEDGELYGATITAVKSLEKYNNKAFPINTPHIPFNDPKESGIALLPTFTQIHIEELTREAELYMQGKRANRQLKLVVNN